VDLKFSSRNLLKLNYILFVPNIRNNLVSRSVLNKLGFKKVFERDKYVLSWYGVFIGFGYYNSRMFSDGF